MELCQSMDSLVLQRQQNHLHRAYLDLGLKKPISEDSVIDSASDDAVFSYAVPRLCEIKWNCDCDCDCFHGSKIGVDTFDTAVTQQQYDVKRPKLRGKQKKQKETPKLRGKKPIIAADCSNGSRIAASTAYTAKQPCDVKQPKLSAKQKKQNKTPKVRWLKPIDSDCSEDDDDDNDFTTLSSRRNAVDKKKGNRSGLFPIRWLTDVERAKYERQVKESGGFDVDCFPGYDAGMIQPVLFSDSEEAWHDCYKSLAILAIENYNYAHQDSKIELSRVVKANFQHDYPGLFYITFEARNAAADNDGAQILNIFQALISSKYGADETVVFCRPKPTPLQSSS